MLRAGFDRFPVRRPWSSQRDLVCALVFAALGGAARAEAPPGTELFEAAPLAVPQGQRTKVLTPVIAPPGAIEPGRGELPGLDIAVLGVSGGSGTGGRFAVGDPVAVTFSVSQDGQPVRVENLNGGGIMVSGPTSNYQRVLARQSDVIVRAVDNGNGTYTYTFAQVLPSTYLAPYNDTPSFGLVNGELQSQPLQAGTYTVGLELYRSYVIGGVAYRDAGNATYDFLFGSGVGLQRREVVGQANCNQCHADLRAHGDLRHDVRSCVLCHTAGAEDGNDPSVEGGTPGVSIDFKVMIHKVHNGTHLPSVCGVGTNGDGSRNYARTPQPYRLLGFQSSVHDFSDVEFPMYPNLVSPMPRDAGYLQLTAAEQASEDRVRHGVTTCDKCHGDPDGEGILQAPAQGGLAHSRFSRDGCGSCHDDVDWSVPYRANHMPMPEQPNNQNCGNCHNPVTNAKEHLHPLLNPNHNKGLFFDLVEVREWGAHNGNGSIEPGEKIRISFSIHNAAGDPVDPSTLERVETVVTGPVGERNVLLDAAIPLAAIPAPVGGTHRMQLPAALHLEIVGRSTAQTGDVFQTVFTPHWDVTGATTTVHARVATGPGATLATAASSLQNYFDLLDASAFARGDYVVVEDGVTGQEEYVRVIYVNGNRLWLSSIGSTSEQPWLRVSHPAGAAVAKVSLQTLTRGSQYSLAAATGTITEVQELGAGTVVLVSYTTDLVMPAVYPPPIDDSPDLGEEIGEWPGKRVIDGTYTVGIWGSMQFEAPPLNENNLYHAASPPATRDFQIGTGPVEPAPDSAMGDRCTACHGEPIAHESRMGFATCVLCHGAAGAEDRPQYVAANAPATPRNAIDFRVLLHKIHRGADLAQGSGYQVVGAGEGYPNNYSVRTFEKVHFPAMPTGVKECVECHGEESQRWRQPPARQHPDGMAKWSASWSTTCGSCHDAAETQIHFAANTRADGAEQCAACHGPGDRLGVGWAHRQLGAPPPGTAPGAGITGG